MSDKKPAVVIDNYEDAELLVPFWTLNDWRLFKDLAEGVIRCDPYDLLKVLTLESQLDPHSVHGPAAWPDAVGLNQMTSIAAIEAKLIKEKSQWPAFAAEIMRMTTAMQLYLVARFFDAVPWGKTGRPYDATKLYQSNFAPYSLPGKTNPSDVLTVKGETLYDGNPELDINHDGKITVADLTSAIGGVPFAKRTAPYYAAGVFMYKFANKV